MTRATQQPPPPVDGVNLEDRQNDKARDSWLKRFWRAAGWDRLVLAAGAIAMWIIVYDTYMSLEREVTDVSLNRSLGNGDGRLSADQHIAIHTEGLTEMLMNICVVGSATFLAWLLVRALMAMKAAR